MAYLSYNRSFRTICTKNSLFCFILFSLMCTIVIAFLYHRVYFARTNIKTEISSVNEEFEAKLKHLEELLKRGITYDDHRVIQIIKAKFFSFPKNHGYNLRNQNILDYSCGQSGAIDKILKQKKGGFFVEAGAFDGESISNTLFFEKERQWNGLLVEPDPFVFERLKAKGRKAILANACLNIKNTSSTLLFNRGNEMGRIWEDKEDKDWVRRNERKIDVIKVPCFPLSSLLLALGVTKVDYLSLDVEGRELSVLKTIPFDKIQIKTMTVEYLFGDMTQTKTYLEKNGYEFVMDIVGNKTCVAKDSLFKRKSQ